MKAISPEELQQVQLQVLDYIDEVCQKNGLKYFLDCGTLLGAVRHKGFIPWDDDIDLIMPRADYERLYEIMKDDERYRFVCHKNDENYILTFGKVYDTRTVIKEKVVDEVNYGVFVDITPFDHLPDNKVIRFLYQTRMRNLCLLYRYKALKYEPKGLKGRIMKTLSNCRSIRSYILKIDKLAQKYNQKKTKFVWTTVFTYLPYAAIEQEVYEKSVPLQFEDRTYPAPQGYERRLRLAYGNYMELPPKEKQVKTHSFEAYWR